MTTLSRDRRTELDTTMRAARRVAEDGARKALEHLAVRHHEPRGHLTPDQRELRKRLRARARQLGDRLDSKGQQQTDRLAEQCAYEHWHRILFARFLAENHLLIHPDSGLAISLRDCRELATERGVDWLTLASEYAVGMLPQVFKAGDVVLDLRLPTEARQELEDLLEHLDPEVFGANDSLGWTYQYWQAEQKEAINASETKIGAEELGPVTQLFTEDYMVDFLLHNTLGAWWARKHGPIRASSEEEARQQVALPAWGDLPEVPWQYLRLRCDEDGAWHPAMSAMVHWPRVAAELTILDPSMGSGHFLVFALPIMARIRAEEEHLSSQDAVIATLRDNLYGLELDERCTQLAAFGLALTAWRLVGYHDLPALNLACSGLSVSATEQDWVGLAKNDMRLEAGMRRLHRLFKNGPILGSLIDPLAEGVDLLTADFRELEPLFDRAIRAEDNDALVRERAVTARGLAKAAEILARTFTLVITNVPYLGRGKQDDSLKQYCQERHPRGKADLATCFVERCLKFCVPGGTTAVVTPQVWLYLSSYKHLRKNLLDTVAWAGVARLGPGAFETITGEVVNVALSILTLHTPQAQDVTFGLDATELERASAKAAHLMRGDMTFDSQGSLRTQPGWRLSLGGPASKDRLAMWARYHNGIQTGDTDRFSRPFWAFSRPPARWVFQHTSVSETAASGGRTWMLLWDGEDGDFLQFVRNRLGGSTGAWIRGLDAWGKRGVLVSGMRHLPATLYDGVAFDNNATVLIPNDQADLPALWAYCSSPDYNKAVRRLNPKMSVTDDSFVHVPFDVVKWRSIAAEVMHGTLPTPDSQDPTQWTFDGHPKQSNVPLLVGVARLLGFKWPRQNGSSFPDCPPLIDDALEEFADKDGIVCLPALHHERTAAARLRELLAVAFDDEWDAGKERQLLSLANAKATTLEEWLEAEFFEQHCTVFLQRPFIWHISDGLRDGFSALVNYHKLAAPNGKGRRTLQKLTHTYLGDWITRQRTDVLVNIDGAQRRAAAAEHLRAELEKILEGEPPYDVFVRWKPLHSQSIGWSPDLSDGIRRNIRPFMIARPYNARADSACILRITPRIKWTKDRGKEPELPRIEYPWYWGRDEETTDFMGRSAFDGIRWNDIHYSNDIKRQARDATSIRSTER